MLMLMIAQGSPRLKARLVYSFRLGTRLIWGHFFNQNGYGVAVVI
jgi:hypothetical protein